MAKYKSVDDLVNAVSEHSGNSLYGDLWRLSLLAKETLTSLAQNAEQARCYLERIDKQINLIEESWCLDSAEREGE